MGMKKTLADHKPKQTSYCTEIHYLLLFWMGLSRPITRLVCGNVTRPEFLFYDLKAEVF